MQGKSFLLFSILLGVFLSCSQGEKVPVPEELRTEFLKEPLGLDEPNLNRDDFNTFWSTGTGWGEFSMKNGKATIYVANGSLRLNQFGIGEINQITCTEKGKSKRHKNKMTWYFDTELKLQKGEKVVFNFN
jgi:hypothetical protein